MQDVAVLVVDHLAARREELVGFLREAGTRPLQAASCDEALALLATTPVPLVFTETELEGKSGFFLLRQVHELHPGVEVVLLDQNATSYNLLQALRSGAFDFIVRPLDTGEILLPTLQRASRHLGLCRHNARLVTELQSKTRALERALEMLRALNASLERLTAIDSIDALLQGLLDSARTVLAARCGFIVLIERHSGDIQVKVELGYAEALSPAQAAKVPPGFISEVVRRGQPILVADTLPPDLAALFSAAEKTRLLPHPGILAVPLLLREREAGLVVLCGHPPDHPFSPEDLSVLEQLSHHTALVLEHLAVIHRLRQPPAAAVAPGPQGLKI